MYIPDTLPLFPQLDTLLLDLLRSLSPADWERPTIAGKWRVKDVAAHLLDGNLRTIAVLRDNYFVQPHQSIDTYHDLVGYLNHLNADWVEATRRLSPLLLIELLSCSGPVFRECLESLDPAAPAIFSVAWAGEQTSINHFHIAREYTEKWHHQQQIRLAVGQEAALYTETFYRPYLATSMRALPHHYRTMAAEEGKLIQFTVTGAGGGDWYLLRTQGAWRLVEAGTAAPDCRTIIPGESAWRILTKGIDTATATGQLRYEGERTLGEHILSLTAVMA